MLREAAQAKSPAGSIRNSDCSNSVALSVSSLRLQVQWSTRHQVRHFASLTLPVVSVIRSNFTNPAVSCYA